MMRPAVRLACLLAALTSLAACGGEVVTPPPDPSPPAPVEAPAPEPVATPAPATRRVAFHPDDLTGDLTGVTELDLAFSATDRLERRASVDDDRSYEHACAGLDLVGLASRAPQLRSLRLSGCQTAAHVGLGAFLNLESLALADLQLDGVTMGRIASLPRLRALSLTRVQAGSEPVAVLGRLAIESLTLRELDNDSPLAAITSQAPQLQSLALEGAWAGHDAMLAIDKAVHLRELRLVDTRVGNFSLHQLKPLLALRRIDWQGNTFNDHSLLYVRELPIESFTCACPGFGDAGLKVIGRQLQLRTLVLPQSRISGAGLAHLVKLDKLAHVTIGRRDPGPEGLAALAALPALSELNLELPALADPTLAPLGQMLGLRRLRLAIPTLDDRAAPQLATLVQLEALDLGDTQISDLGLKPLAGLVKLRELKLHHTHVTNRGLANLAGLTQLELLELDHTDLVDAGVAHLAGLRALRVLRLDKTLITDAALPHLLAMDHLEQLNLADTVVTAEGVAVLQRLPALRAVNLARTRAEPAAD